jgi:hypothetical protein
MNARLQGALLNELYSILPEQAQMWVATHSIGMMRKARELAETAPNTVAFLDFGDRNFDEAVIIEPSRPTRAFWQRQLAVAIDDLAELVAPREIVICEGNPAGPIPGKNAEHDATCYEAIFSDEYPDVKFLSAGNAADVAKDKLSFVSALPKIAAGIRVRRLIDRDDHGPAEVAKFNADGIRVLLQRNIESYLFAEEILNALCHQEGKIDKLQDVIAAKAEAIKNSVARGNPADDIKSAAGEIYNDIKRILRLTARGNDHRSFARSTLAPLVKPGTLRTVS